MENLHNSDSLETAAQTLAVTCAAIADVHYLNSVGSTNTWLKEQYEAGNVTRPVLVLTDSQTAGRGTRGREWLQAGQDLALSFGAIADADVEIDQRLSLAVGVVVAQAIEGATGLAIRVKWPNDVLTRHLDAAEHERWRKVSGTLIESVVGADQRLIAIGVGINVNSTAGDYPLGLAGRLTTLRDALGTPVSLSILTTYLCTRLLKLVALVAGLRGRPATAAEAIDHLVADWFECDITAGTRYLLNREGSTIPVTACRVDRQTCGLVCVDDQQREYLITSYTELSPAEDR